jgi:hypothetical protein
MKKIDVEYTTSDKSIYVKMTFTRVQRKKIYHVGKSWPIHTQCVISVNGLVESFATVVKHNIDEDNPQFAYKIASRKATAQLNTYLKAQLNRVIHNQIQHGLLSADQNEEPYPE